MLKEIIKSKMNNDSKTEEKETLTHDQYVHFLEYMEIQSRPEARKNPLGAPVIKI